jgi:Asp-tRNA(Asn)/Glu-tRNA(Gln) amidotransferase A subunit family amidase
MARSAADCAVLLEAIAGEDPSDGASESSAKFSAADAAPPSRPPRLGVMRRYFFESFAAEAARATDAALEVLRAAGAEIVELKSPEPFDFAFAMHRRIMACEAGDVHRQLFAERRSGYGPQTSALLEEGLALSMADYQEALRYQVHFRNAAQRMLSAVDALIAPSTVTAAPPLSANTTGDPRFNSVWSLAQLPTVSIPCALDAAGLPLSITLAGVAHSEAHLLGIATWCEEKINFRDQSPMARG